MRTPINNGQNLIDIRDVIARVEELEDMLPGNASEVLPGTSNEIEEARDELRTLAALLTDCRDNGGDEQWRGNWYPSTLIRDSYFTNYAMDLADDIGAVTKHGEWPYTYIDWDAAASALQTDYTSVDFDGVDYWVR